MVVPLEAMFGQGESDIQKMEKVVLTQNLEGFASCFPDWDLHPPIKNNLKLYIDLF